MSVGDIENLPRSGWPKLLNDRAQGAACINEDLKKNRATLLSESTSRFTECRQRSVSRRTVQRVLFKSAITDGLFGRRSGSDITTKDVELPGVETKFICQLLISGTE